MSVVVIHIVPEQTYVGLNHCVCMKADLIQQTMYWLKSDHLNHKMSQCCAKENGCETIRVIVSIQ